MTLEVKCSVIQSIKVNLKFEDGMCKERVIGVGDLIDVDFNCNGIRKSIEGRVVKVYVEGSDARRWYIIVDSSDDFDATQYKFSPMNIIDLEIIKKKDATQYIETTNDFTNIRALRIVHGRLQYTQDGHNWWPINIDPDDIIHDEEYGVNRRPHHNNCSNTEPDDIIHDEVNE